MYVCIYIYIYIYICIGCFRNMSEAAQIQAHCCVLSDMQRFSKDIYGSKREKPIIHESLQETCFVLLEISERIRKSTGECNLGILYSGSLLKFPNALLPDTCWSQYLFYVEGLCIGSPELAAPGPQKKHRDRLGCGTYANGLPTTREAAESC